MLDVLNTDVLNRRGQRDILEGPNRSDNADAAFCGTHTLRNFTDSECDNSKFRVEWTSAPLNTETGYTHPSKHA